MIRPENLLFPGKSPLLLCVLHDMLFNVKALSLSHRIDKFPSKVFAARLSPKFLLFLGLFWKGVGERP